MIGEMKIWRKKKIGDFTEEKRGVFACCFASHYLFSTFPHEVTYAIFAQWEKEVLMMTMNSDEEGKK